MPKLVIKIYNYVYLTAFSVSNDNNQLLLFFNEYILERCFITICQVIKYEHTNYLQ